MKRSSSVDGSNGGGWWFEKYLVLLLSTYICGQGERKVVDWITIMMRMGKR